MWRIAHFRTQRLFCSPWQAAHGAMPHWGPVQRRKLKESGND